MIPSIALGMLFFSGEILSAQPPQSIGEILKDDAAFAKFSRSWRSQCDDVDIKAYDPDIESHLRDFAVETIREGLRRLHRVNAPLVEDALIWALEPDNNLLQIGCRRDAGSLAGYQGPAIASDFGRFDMGHLAYALAVSHSPEALAVLGHDPFEEHRDEFKLYFFHEYLHALDLDNEPATHNKTGTQAGGAQVDVVYACSAQAFPEADYAIAVDENGKLYSNTGLACDTCARAKKAQYGSILDKSPDGDARVLQAGCDKLPGGKDAGF